MCEACEYTDTTKTRGRSVNQMFPFQTRVIPYEHVKPGHCMLTGQRLTEKEMYEAGATTHSLKAEVYENLTSRRHQECEMCKRPLPKHIYQEQCRHPREIKEYFCPECFQYWAILHAKVVGVDLGFIEDQVEAAHDQVHRVEPIHEPVETYVRQAIPVPEPAHIQRASHEPVQKVDIVASMKRMHRDVIEAARQDLPMPPVPELDWQPKEEPVQMKRVYPDVKGLPAPGVRRISYEPVETVDDMFRRSEVGQAGQRRDGVKVINLRKR